MAIITGYTPSPAAFPIPTPDGTQVVWDILEWPDNIIRPLSTFLAEKLPDGSWDYLKGSIYGSLWAEDEYSSETYTHPDGTTFTGTLLDILNHYGTKMISDYVPKVNQLLAARFTAVPTTPVTTTTQTFPAATLADARQALAGFLHTSLSAQVVNGVPKVSLK